MQGELPAWCFVFRQLQNPENFTEDTYVFNIQLLERNRTYMDYTEFREELFIILQKIVPKEISIKLVEAEKLNGCIRYGIMFDRTLGLYAHTIYLEPFYRSFEKGKSLEEIAKELLKCFEEEKNEVPECMDKFHRYDLAREHIYCKLISRRENQKLLQDTPHMPFLDFAIVAYFEVNSTEVYKGSILIKDKYLMDWGITAEEFLVNALEHTRKDKGVTFISMEEVLADFYSSNELQIDREFHSKMYVLTNKEKYLGAVLICFPEIMTGIAQMLEDDFYLLPASIHEWIIIPENAVSDRMHLLSVVRNINCYEVLEEEVLSNDIYLYSQKSQENHFTCISDVD